MTRRELRAMRARWQRDLDRLEAAYPEADWSHSEPVIETIRNLATAIAEVAGIINSKILFPKPEALPSTKDTKKEGGSDNG